MSDRKIARIENVLQGSGVVREPEKKTRWASLVAEMKALERGIVDQQPEATEKVRQFVEACNDLRWVDKKES